MRRTVSVAVFFTPASDAETVTDSCRGVAAVDTVKLAVDLPSGTVTVGGTLAADGRVLASATTAPPVGAGPESVTVPMDFAPPNTETGLRASAESAGAGGGGGGGGGGGVGGGGVAVRAADLVAPP